MQDALSSDSAVMADGVVDQVEWASLMSTAGGSTLLDKQGKSAAQTMRELDTNQV